MTHPVRHKIAMPFKLELVVGLGTGQRGLDHRDHHFQAVRVQPFDKVLAARIGLGLGKQTVVQAHFGPQAVGHGNPADQALDLDAARTQRAVLGVGEQVVCCR